MIHPAKLFKRIHRRGGYTHIGKKVSFKFWVNRKDGDNTIYLCFQGSNGLLDWLYNFLAIVTSMQPYSGCGWWVHKGFALVWRSANEAIMGKLMEMHERLPGFDIVFCGFSHGAALAQLAAQNWHHLTGQRRQCVIFGAPKLAWTGKGSALRILNNAMILTSWINPFDAVTRVPLARWRFAHVRVDEVKVPGSILSLVNINKHHQIYDREEIYPESWRRAA